MGIHLRSGSVKSNFVYSFRLRLEFEWSTLPTTIASSCKQIDNECIFWKWNFCHLIFENRESVFLKSSFSWQLFLSNAHTQLWGKLTVEDFWKTVLKDPKLYWCRLKLLPLSIKVCSGKSSICNFYASCIAIRTLFTCCLFIPLSAVSRREN